jgi:SNF2 family DNA or RNA helicase
MANPVEMELSGTKIVLRLSKSSYDVYAMNLAGKVKNDQLGVFEYTMNPQNLEKIFKVFDGKALPKPVVTKGQEWLERQRENFRIHRGRKRVIQDIMKVERYPIEPNGKFVPYAHQTKIVGAVLSDPFTPVFSDCGTGKTGSVGRAVEIGLNNGEIARGKVLISAPKSILFSSWGDDLTKFTNLRYKVLWTPLTNKTKRQGEKVVLGHGLAEAPAGTLTTKSRKAMRWVKGSEMKSGRLNLFEEAEGGWVKMEVSWRDAISQAGTPTTVGPIYGQPVEKERTRENFIAEALKNPDVDVFLINHDAVRIYQELLKKHEFDWIIVDESTKIKSPQSKVTKSHIEISWRAKRRVIMTGTPNPNGFMDLWSQFYFLDRGLTLGSSLKDYRHDYFTPVSVGRFAGRDAVKWELQDQSLKECLIQKIRESSVFFEQRDCIDLPPRSDLTRDVYMTGEQSRVYKKMEEDLVAELLDQKTGENIMIEASNTLSKLMKLRQITSGFIGHAGDIHKVESLENNPKLDEMDDFIEELGGKKVVIACQFREEIYTLLERYKDRGIAAIFGDESLEKRTANIRRFQTTDELQIMVLQPQAAAHGITLTEAHYFAFLSLDYNFEYYYQTGKRIERLGQKNPMFVYHFLARTESGRQTIDHDLMEVLKSKAADRNALFSDNAGTKIEIAEQLKRRLIERVHNQ